MTIWRAVLVAALIWLILDLGVSAYRVVTGNDLDSRVGALEDCVVHFICPPPQEPK